ncbi:hypothetical protein AWB81_07707 [Caballeronia arationis]|jgi:hypothetical protein|uniref:Uncharacterized protein n=1 Tax=Caballeronia arationis TaxID=1777142 RepID=A0A7Z7I4W4_9BURK|nr:hypothetical protein AWB81_07707 [Caballeronia arationis]SOE56010.1 hypothetical protein SAMN05446927_1142 [Caballeronia arationis]
MWIFRVGEHPLGAVRIREWCPRARHTIGLFVQLPHGAASGLDQLAQSGPSFPDNVLTAISDWANHVTTLGSPRHHVWVRREVA